MDDASQAAACFDRAIEARRQGQLSEAAGLALQAASLDPASLDANLLAATLLDEQDLAADAVPFAECALRLLPQPGLRERIQPVLRLAPLAARDPALRNLLLDTVDSVSPYWTASPDLLAVLAWLTLERPSSAVTVVERLLAEERSLLLYAYLEWGLSQQGGSAEERTKSYVDALLSAELAEADEQLARLDGAAGGRLPAAVRRRVRGWLRERYDVRAGELGGARAPAAIDNVEEREDGVEADLDAGDSDVAWRGWVLLALLVAGAVFYLLFLGDPDMRRALAAVVVLAAVFNGGRLPSAVEVLNVVALAVLTIAIGWAGKSGGASGPKAVGAFVGFLVGAAVAQQAAVGPGGELILPLSGAFLGLVVTLYLFGGQKERRAGRLQRRLRDQLRLEARLKGNGDETADSAQNGSHHTARS